MHNFQEHNLNSKASMDDYTACPLHRLVLSDRHYGQFVARFKDPNETDQDGNTLLHAAAQGLEDNSRTVQLLIKGGADVNSTNPDRHTPLHVAVASRKRDAVVFLIEAGASVNAEDSNGRSVLHFAVCKKKSYRSRPVFPAEFDMWIVERLLCHPEICLNQTDAVKETALMWAVREQNTEAVNALLKKGANPDIPRQQDNRTALHEALYAHNPNISIVSTLLCYGAGIYCEDILRNTAVDILARNALLGFGEWLPLAKHALLLIALRYQIRDSLWGKLEMIPDLYEYFKECHKEVGLMRKLIIYDKVTLHDFCLNCFQMRSGDPVRNIYVPAVEMLVSELFTIYHDFLFIHVSESDLRGVLEIGVGRPFAIDLVPKDASRESVFYVVRRVYSQCDELKRRLLAFKHLL